MHEKNKQLGKGEKLLNQQHSLFQLRKLLRNLYKSPIGRSYEIPAFGTPKVYGNRYGYRMIKPTNVHVVENKYSRYEGNDDTGRFFVVDNTGGLIPAGTYTYNEIEKALQKFVFDYLNLYEYVKEENPRTPIYRVMYISGNEKNKTWSMA